MKKLFLAVIWSALSISAFALSPTPFTEGVILSMRATMTYSGGSLAGSASLSIIGEGGTGSSSASYNAGEGAAGRVWLKPGKKYSGGWSFSAGGAPNMSTGINLAGDMSFIAPTGYTLYLNGVPVDVAHDAYYFAVNSGGSVYGSKNFDIELRANAESTPLPAGAFTGISFGKAISWEVGLGALRAGQSAGRIVFRELDLTNSPGSRDRIIYTAPSNNGQVTVTKDSGTEKLQKIVTPQAIVDLVDEGSGYRIKFSDPVSLTQWRSILVQYAAGVLTITENEGTVSRVSTLSVAVVSGNNNWTLQEGNSSTVLRTTTHTNTVPASGQRDDLVVVRTGSTGGTIVQKTKYHYVAQDPLNGWGEELAEIHQDPDTANLTTTYVYHTTLSAAGNYLRVKSITYPTGGWASFSYYDDWDRRGQLAVETRPFVDTPASATAASLSTGNSVSHSYGPDYSGRYRIEYTTANYVTNVQAGASATLPTILQWRNGLRFTAYQRDDSASSSLTQRTISEVIDSDQPGDYAGQLLSVKRPDQSQDSYAFYQGGYSGTTFTTGSGNYFRTIAWHGSTNSSGATALTTFDSQAVASIYLVPNKSTMEVTIRNPAGLVVRTELWVCTSGTSFTQLSSENFTYDVAGRLTQSVAANNAVTTNTYANGQLTGSTAGDGTVTQFTYDEIGRVKTSTKVGAGAVGTTYAAQKDIGTTYTYDAVGHITKAQTTDLPLPATLSVITTDSYDLAGRPTQHVDNSLSSYPVITGYGYSSGGRIMTVTMPSGYTKVLENFLDGQLKQITGTGVVYEYLAYSINGSGQRLIDHRTSSSTSPRLVTKTADWLGRTVMQSAPSWTGVNATSQFFYNSSGQLTKSTLTGSADTLYQYDTLGRMYRQALDVNANGSIDLSGGGTAETSDRITETNLIYYNAGSGDWWLESQKIGYASVGSGTATVLSTQYDRVANFTGTTRSETHIYDIHGNFSAVIINSDPSTLITTRETVVPGSNVSVYDTIRNGLLQTSRSSTNLTTSYLYDALSRVNGVTDPRTGTTTTAYKADTNLVGNVKDPANVTQVAYDYDSAGRIKTTTNAAGKVSRVEYNNLGQILHKWGDVPNPVEYGYDGYGQQTGMKTYRAGSGWTGTAWPTGPAPGTADVTTWTYQESTGLLQYKVDAAGKSTGYTYSQAGQLLTRTSARGIVTTYAYSGTTGELTGKSYSDGTTAIGYTYNRIGGVATVSDETGTRTFNYDLAGTLELTNEVEGSLYGDFRITRGYETTGSAKGRYNQLAVGTAANPYFSYNMPYGYDATGRLNQAWYFSYTYTANSDLINTVSYSSWNYYDSRTYNANHDWTASRVTTNGSTTRASFVYTPDNLGRTTSVLKTGELFDAYGTPGQGLTTSYGYNDRSELTSNVTKLGTSSTVLTGRSDAFAFDNIGDRSSTTHNGNTANYSTNALNQYTQRDVPGVYDISGCAPGATVTVNGSSSGVVRQGQYYFDPFAMSNNPNAAFANVSVSDGSTTSTVAAFLPGTPHIFLYDDDGNMTYDGKWGYAYNAENRPTWMQTNDLAVAANLPKQGIALSYDYLGRRVRKTTYNWVSGNWAVASDLIYLYDGSNVLFELNGQTGNSAVRCHVWGLDLSGTLQGAGGVGGLLATYDVASGIWADPIYDGMGNVHGMINKAGGAIIAAYEYDAFGRTIRKDGGYATSFPFRYSTKYTDLETDLVYYGQRYYSPGVGRFVNRDPIEEAGGLNLYGFCGNNGVNGYDLLGMSDPAPGSPDEIIDWNGGRFSRAYIAERLAEQDYYRAGTMLPTGGFWGFGSGRENSGPEPWIPIFDKGGNTDGPLDRLGKRLRFDRAPTFPSERQPTPEPYKPLPGRNDPGTPGAEKLPDQKFDYLTPAALLEMRRSALLANQTTAPKNSGGFMGWLNRALGASMAGANANAVATVRGSQINVMELNIPNELNEHYNFIDPQLLNALSVEYSFGLSAFGGSVAVDAEMLALPAPRQAEGAWGALNTYREGGQMTALEHINYRHAFESGFSDVSRFAEGTSVRDIKSFVDQALRYGQITPQGLNGFKFEYNIGNVIGTGLDGGAATGIRGFVRNGNIQTAFPVGF